MRRDIAENDADKNQHMQPRSRKTRCCSMRTTKSFLLKSFLVSTCGALLIAAGNAPAAELSTAPAQTEGKNVLIIGHSLTHCLRGLEPLSLMVGHPKHQ